METKLVTPKRTAGSRFRRAFITGLIVLAPVWLTVYIVLVVVRLLGGLLSPYLRALAEITLVNVQLPHGVLVTAVDVVAFFLTVLLIALVGWAFNRVMGKRAFDIMDSFLRSIPFVRDVYGGVRRVSDVLFGEKAGFSRVVAVRFPTPYVWSIGFMTNDTAVLVPPDSGIAHVTVFIPTTPNPTTGYLIYCPTDQILPLAMSVDEAMKTIISAGTILPEGFDKLKNT